MPQSDVAGRFSTLVTALPDLETLKRSASALKAAGMTAGEAERIDLCAALAHVGFLAPDKIGAVYDAVAEGWLGRAIDAAPIGDMGKPSSEVPAGLWQAFWSVVDDAVDGKLNALTITQRTAALGGLLDDEFSSRAAAAARLYPGVTEAVGALPARISLDELGACPEGSLGRRFHSLIVDNAFDLEVLDREALSLSALPKPLDYLNTRILQSHDLWHIVAGYETTALHEIALSAFQMAQFGHNYSAQFLAVTAGVAAVTPAMGYPVLMETVMSAWAHGRETPPLMAVPWEEVWSQTTEDIRAAFHVTPYQSPYPANLIEMTQGAQ